MILKYALERDGSSATFGNPDGGLSVEWQRLGELADLISGFPLHRLRGETGGHFPVLEVRDLAHSNDPGWNLTTVPLRDTAPVSRYRVRAGDVAVTSKGVDLKVALISGHWQGAVLGSNLVRIRLNGRLRPELLLVFLQSATGRMVLEQHRTGSNLLNLTVEHLCQIMVPVPPIGEQDRLAELVRVSHEHSAQALRAAKLREQIAARIVLDSFKAKGEAL